MVFSSPCHSISRKAVRSKHEFLVLEFLNPSPNASGLPAPEMWLASPPQNPDIPAI